MPDFLCHKTEFIDGTVSYSEDPDDSTLIDRYLEYEMDKHLGDRPQTPTQQREVRYKIMGSRKKEHASMTSNMSAIPDKGKPDGKDQ